MQFSVLAGCVQTCVLLVHWVVSRRFEVPLLWGYKTFFYQQCQYPVGCFNFTSEVCFPHRAFVEELSLLLNKVMSLG